MASNARVRRDATSSHQLHSEELAPAHRVSRGLLVVELVAIGLAQVSIVGARRNVTSPLSDASARRDLGGTGAPQRRRREERRWGAALDLLLRFHCSAR